MAKLTDAELTDAEIDAALTRGKIARANEPCAIKARYDRRLRRMVVDLTSSCTFSFKRTGTSNSKSIVRSMPCVTASSAASITSSSL